MSLRLTKKQLDKLLSKSNISSEEIKGIKREVKTKKECKIKSSRAVNSDIFSHEDSVEINKNEGSILIKLSPVKLLTYNVIMVNHNAKVNTYKRSFKERLVRLADKNKDKLREWTNDDRESKFVLEAVHFKKGKFADSDSYSASLKSVIDGLVESGIVVDDSTDSILFTIPIQVKSEKEMLYLKLKPEKCIKKYISPEFHDLI